MPLGDYVEGRFYRGILTGYNDAFVIRGDERAKLIDPARGGDPRAAEIIKPYLRGRDVKRLRVEPEDLWLIRIESSGNVRHPWSGLPEKEAEAKFAETWPAIHRRFTSPEHLEALRARYDKGQYWWELRACAYWDAFDGPKIIIPAIESSVAYASDHDGFISNDKTSIIVDERWRYLLACLNSAVSWWYTKALFASRAGGFDEFKPMYVGAFPVPKAEAGQASMVEALTDAVIATRDPALEQLLGGLIYELYFAPDLHARGLHLFTAAAEAGLDRLAGLEGTALTTAATAFARERLAPGTALRTMLSDLQTLDVVRVIEGKV